MIAYLPEIYPDELVYSWFCRYYIHSGCFSHKMALQDLYCKRSDNPNKEFIGNLNQQAREAIVQMYALDMLTLNHTMFPLYARFIPLEQRKNALYRIGYDSCDIHHLFPVLPRTNEEQYLRYCPLCAKEDRERYSEAYWRRKHQIRNIRICTKHNCKLHATEISAKSEQNYVFYPAENMIRDDSVVYEDNPAVLSFAAFIEAVFDAPMDIENDTPICSILYDGMSRTKYLKPSGRSRYTKLLADDLKVFYEKLGVCNIATMNQIQNVLLRNRYDFSVICQIAFFLGMTDKELTQPSLTMERIQTEQNSHYMKDAAPIDWVTLDAETAPKMEAFAKGVYTGTANINGRPERVSERLVYREMGLLGHQLENMPRCKAIFERYTESYPESWARKIIWAYQKLSKMSERIYWFDICKLSGVKKAKIDVIVPYLYRHIDEETVAKIIKIIGK